MSVSSRLPDLLILAMKSDASSGLPACAARAAYPRTALSGVRMS